MSTNQNRRNNQQQRRQTSDSPLATLKRIKAQESAPVATYPLPGSSQRITFPDPYAMEVEDAEAFFAKCLDAERTGRVTPALKHWLSEEDYDALKQAHPTLKEMLAVFFAAQQHYEAHASGLGG